MRVLILCLIAVALAGCSSWGFPGVYKINVEQGNIVTAEMVDQLKPGMSRRQVRYILGTPLLEDSFDRDRWDYIYTLRNGDTLIVDNRLSIFFEGETMAHYTSTLPPLEPIDVAEPEEPLQ